MTCPKCSGVGARSGLHVKGALRGMALVPAKATWTFQIRKILGREQLRNSCGPVALKFMEFWGACPGGSDETYAPQFKLLDLF